MKNRPVHFLFIHFPIMHCMHRLGSRIVLEQRPYHVAQYLAKTLTLRCALEDTSAPNDTSARSSISAGLSGTTYRTVGTEIVPNFDIISSIEISRNGERLAYLEQNSLPQVEGDWSNIGIVGDLSLPMSSPGDERAYLELMWSPPSYNQTGEYTCRINATGTSPLGGGEETFEVSSEIGVQFPSKTDMARQMRFYQLEDEANKQKLASLQAAVGTLKAAHAESGVVSCGDSSGWNQYIGSRRYIFKDVRFRRAYTGTAPVVSLGIKGIDVYRYKNLRMQLDVVNLSTRGFRVRCGTWGDTRIYSLSVRWTSAVA